MKFDDDKFTMKFNHWKPLHCHFDTYKPYIMHYEKFPSSGHKLQQDCKQQHNWQNLSHVYVRTNMLVYYVNMHG